MITIMIIMMITVMMIMMQMMRVVMMKREMDGAFAPGSFDVRKIYEECDQDPRG